MGPSFPELVDRQLVVPIPSNTAAATMAPFHDMRIDGID
jgi:hypothetical protein